MKLRGQTVEPPKPIPVVIPRDEGDLGFMVYPVMEYAEFEQFCPEPKPPLVIRPNDPAGVADPDDPRFRETLNTWAGHKTEYMIIKALTMSGELEFETVKIEDPDTWSGYEDELLQCFTEREVSVLVDGAITANMPTAARQQQAKERFMSPLSVDSAASTSPMDEPDSTISGDLVNDLG